MRLYSLRLPEELIAALSKLKERDGITESESIRRAVVQFLKEKRIPNQEKGAKGNSEAEVN
jgi:metal-responsive CopG/Arc/MetJ family transcriptional regulator